HQPANTAWPTPVSSSSSSGGGGSSSQLQTRLGCETATTRVSCLLGLPTINKLKTCQGERETIGTTALTWAGTWPSLPMVSTRRSSREKPSR
ncbi:unnamed protein product, partial [Laminaria digitata]